MPEPDITIPVQGTAGDVDETNLPPITCPITGCGWKLEQVPPNVSETFLADIFGPGTMAFEARVRYLAEVDLRLSEHLDRHPIGEFVAEITRLTSLVHGLTAALAELPRLLSTAAIQTG